MKTAVEWLVDKLMKGEFINDTESLIERAKQMEKFHIMEAWHNGLSNQTEFFSDHTGTIVRANCAEKYYNETFKSE
jgi:hypothetical protein